MKRKQCIVLEHCRDFIIENIDGKRLLDPMVEGGIFSTDDDDEIRSNQTRKACAERFYEKLLQSKHDNTYDTFKTALKVCNVDYIVKELEKYEKKYENEPETNLPDPRKTTGGKVPSSSNVKIVGSKNSVIVGGSNISININN
ncbi:uncharacterized protein [Antedon mediterranea]|uniref:uncharacterized protein n=1 Tax=Antedon mediterranea TaxID=105859 RepID=UPI003AF51EA9